MKNKRLTRLSDLVRRALIRASIPSAEEPTGLSRSDGKRPDGLSLTHWRGGKRFTWDATVADTLVDTRLVSASTTAGAVSSKERRQNILTPRGHVTVFAIETLGPLNVDRLKFFSELDDRLSNAAHDQRNLIPLPAHLDSERAFQQLIASMAALSANLKRANFNRSSNGF